MKDGFLRTMMVNYKHINDTEDGISFAKEGFNQLYDTFIEEQETNSYKLKKAFGVGLIYGSAIMGATAIIIGERSRRRKERRRLNKVNESREE